MLFAELLSYNMNNTAINESHSDIEELFDDEEGERPCYLSDDLHIENANKSHAASNSDAEVDNTTKLSNLDISQGDGEVHEGGPPLETANIISENHDSTEEGKEQFQGLLLPDESAMNYSDFQLETLMHRVIYLTRHIRVDKDWQRLQSVLHRIFSYFFTQDMYILYIFLIFIYFNIEIC